MHPSTSSQDQARRSKFRLLTVSTLFASTLLISTLRAQAVASADLPNAEPTHGDAIKLMEYFVSEHGVSRAANALTPEDTKLQLPGTTVEKLLSKIPGINVVVRDSFGFYEFGNDIRVRSFGINQVGVTIDDVPMGSNSPRYGLPSGRVTDSENISSVVVSQGAGDLTTPAYEALGGSIKYNTITPTDLPGGTIKVSVGDANSTRVYAKYNVGEFYPGMAAWVSASQIHFKEPGIPEFSEGHKVEAKVTITKSKFKGMLAYTYNERDDYDTRTINYDALRALQSRQTYTVYPYEVYKAGATTGAIGTLLIPTYAKYGFINYTPDVTFYNNTGAQVNGSSAALDNTGIFGNFTNNARQFGQNTFVDTSRNLGDGINATNYFWAKNGRRDSFFRGKGEVQVSDSLTLIASGYIQGRNYYGTATIPRSSALTQIQLGYKSWKAAGGVGPRPDIWATYAYKDASGNLVPFGTAGATPLGFIDANGNGFLDPGEKLDFTSTPTEFSSAQALIGKGSTAAAPLAGIPGHTARYEDFGGPRLGGLLKGEYLFQNHLITAGTWFEDDFSKAIRPQYNILGGSIQGPQQFNQVLFVNYDRRVDTKVANAFVQDDVRFMDDKLKMNFGSKLIYADRVAKGWLTTLDWVNNARRTNAAKYHDYFLPQVGGSYKVSKHVEAFTNWAETFAVPPTDLLLGLNTPGIDPAIKGEKSTNYEAGIRVSGKQLGATFAIFKNDYTNRIGTLSLTTQQQIDRGVLNTTGATYYTEAGAIKSQGAELGYEWKTPLKGLKVTGSFSYLTSKFNDDIRVAYQTWMDGRNAGLTTADYSVLAPYQARFAVSTDKAVNGDALYALAHISGKSQLNTPKYFANADLSYVIGSWSFTFGTEYKGAVALDAFNIEKAPSYIRNSLFAAWHGQRGTKLAPFGLSLSVSNLFDKAIYYGGTGGSSPVAATLFSGTVIADQGRQGVVTVDARF